MEQEKKCIRCGDGITEFTLCRNCRKKENQEKYEREIQEIAEHDNKLKTAWLFDLNRKKYCIGCNKHKLLKHFDFSGVSKDGYTIKCKICTGKEAKPKLENKRLALEKQVEFYSNSTSKVEILIGNGWVPMPEVERLQKLEQAKTELQEYLDSPSVKKHGW